MKWDDLAERNFARCVERVAQYADVPSTLVASHVLLRVGDLIDRFGQRVTKITPAQAVAFADIDRVPFWPFAALKALGERAKPSRPNGIAHDLGLHVETAAANRWRGCRELARQYTPVRQRTHRAQLGEVGAFISSQYAPEFWVRAGRRLRWQRARWRAR